MRSKWFNAWLAFVLLALSGCSAFPGGRAEAAEARSDKPRITSPDVSEADLEELARGNAGFALALYQAVRGNSGNLFYSPYSISVALAMTYAGARGETARQMAEVLRFTLPPERLHPAWNALDLELASRSQQVADEKEKRFSLHVANALWGQAGYRFLPDFLDLLAENYGAGMRLVDFGKDPEAAHQTINRWVSDQTKKRIQDLIPAGVVSPLTRLVLTNAIYFDAAWQHPFPKEATHDAPFTRLDGSRVQVPMMRKSAPFGCAKGEGYQAVELPYVGRQLAMVVLLPDAGEFAAFEGSLDAARLEGILEDLEGQEVALTLPKFRFETPLGLAKILADMGMPDAFSPGQADFSGMDGAKDLFIQDVLHKAFVAVDEAGTEAAAATAVVIGLTAMPATPVEVTVDRPFLFLIRDRETGAILFLGRVLDPSG